MLSLSPSSSPMARCHDVTQAGLTFHSSVLRVLSHGYILLFVQFYSCSGSWRSLSTGRLLNSLVFSMLQACALMSKPQSAAFHVRGKGPFLQPQYRSHYILLRTLFFSLLVSAKGIDHHVTIQTSVHHCKPHKRRALSSCPEVLSPSHQKNLSSFLLYILHAYYLCVFIRKPRV